MCQSYRKVYGLNVSLDSPLNPYSVLHTGNTEMNNKQFSLHFYPKKDYIPVRKMVKKQVITLMINAVIERNTGGYGSTEAGLEF